MGDLNEDTNLTQQNGGAGDGQDTANSQGQSSGDQGQGAGSNDQSDNSSSSGDGTGDADGKETTASNDAKKPAKGGKPKNAAPAADPAGVTGAAAVAAGKSAGSGAKKSIQSIPGLEVTSIQDGFWRGDLQWSTTPTVVKLADLTKHQIEQIKGEPILTVVEVDISVEAEG